MFTAFVTLEKDVDTMKKMMSLFLAMLMVMALAVPAFAEEEEAPSNEMTVTTTVTVPPIDVDIPTTGKVFINPMGFIVKMDDGAKATVAEATATEGNVTSSEQIVSPVAFITNKSAMKLDVKAYAYATVGDTGIEVLTEAPAADSTSKQVFVYAQFDTVAASAKDTTKKLTKADYAAPGTDGKSKTLAILAENPGTDATYQTVGTMAAATGTEANTLSYLGLQFFGKVVQEPEEAWTDGAHFDVKMVFKFAVNTES